MKFGLLFSLSLLSLTTAEICRAADDVYVDLSVLNSLQAPEAAMTAQPLFPEVKETPAAPKAKSVKKTPKISVKKKIPAAPVEKKIEVAPLPEVKIEEPAVSDVAIEKTEQENNLSALKKAIEENSVRKEPLPEAREEVSAENVAEAQAPENAPADNLPGMSVIPSSSETTVIPAENMSSTVKQNAEPETTEAAEHAESEASAPAVEKEAAAEVDDTGGTIVFGPESSELTDADKSKIDAIIAGFEDANNNKVAITAYNLDDGKEVFYRKKQSLDRAIAIRSYLLGRGYKNYSIKVINIPAGDERVNTVDVVELR